MKELLKRIKLVDYLEIELDIQKSDFVNRLDRHVDEGSTGMFSDTFDVFSSSKNEYKGEVNSNGFKIKRRRRFFDMNMNMANAKGTFTQKENKLIINTEINGFHGMMIPFYVFCILIYGTAIAGIFFTENSGVNDLDLFLPFILIHGVFMMGIPYFIMRRSTKRLKYELEREFFFLTK